MMDSMAVQETGRGMNPAPMYRVVVHDEPARDCWAEFSRGWDALEYAKAAARQGYDAEVWYGNLEVAYDAESRKGKA